MPLYVCDPATELTGSTVLSLTTHILHREVEHILQKHGLAEIDPNAWYPLQSVLNVLKDIGEEGDALSNFVSIGIAAAELGAKNLPPDMQNMSLEEFLIAYDRVYRMRHRNGDAGQLVTEKVGEGHLKIILEGVPYPDDIYYGVIYGYTRHFLPRGVSFMVKYDEHLPRQRDGSDTTVLHVTWR